ncbi:sn-glycerol-1-phosphate dehydrogenase, partial [Halanaerobium sp.]
MNINKINGIECNCGRTHQIPIDEIIIGEKVINELDNILRKYTNASKFYLIVDKNTKKVVGHRIKKIILDNDWKIEEILLEEKKENDHVEPDTDALFKILSSVDTNGYLLACGSGTINDLTAFAADKMNMPYSIITTAPSMDGYASSVSSITVNGVKQTYNINPPELIIADLELLSEAPWKMIQSGLGDLLGKISSLLEWKLGKVLFDEYFCSKAFLLIKNTLDNLMENSDEIKNREEKGIKILTEGLINSGIAMMMVESSRPASGTEHHISHFFDMYSEIYQKPVPPHGIKVGIALNISTYFYLKLLNSKFDDFTFDHNKLKRKKNIKRFYLDKSSTIINLLDKRW